MVTRALNVTKNAENVFSLKKFLFLLLIILISDSPVFMYTTNSLVSIFKFCFICILPLALALFYVGKNGFAVKRKTCIIFVLLLSNIIITTLISGDSINAGLLLGAKIVTALFLPLIWPYYNFQYTFLKLMRIIACISLVGYILFQINPELIQMMPTIDVYTARLNDTQPLVTVLFTNIYAWAGTSWTIRNFGPFWEPGAFAAYLNFALFLVLFKSKAYKGKILDIILFLICIVTTVSTGGIAATMFLIIIYIFRRENENRAKWVKYLILIVVAIASLYISSNEEYLLLFEERLGDMDSGSTYSRMYSIFGNIALFMRSPIWGQGIQRIDIMLEDYYHLVAGGGNIHNTNTILIYYSALGVIFGGIFTYMWYKFVSIKQHQYFGNIILFFFIFVMLSNEDFTGSLFFTIVPVYALYFSKEIKNEYTMDQQLPFAKN